MIWLLILTLYYKPPKASRECKPGKHFFKSYHSTEIPKPMKWRQRYILEEKKAHTRRTQ